MDKFVNTAKMYGEKKRNKSYRRTMEWKMAEKVKDRGKRNCVRGKADKKRK